MALVTIPGGLWIPRPASSSTAVPAFTSIVLDATAEKLAFVFPVPKTGTLDKVEWRTGTTVTLNAASQIRTSFQDLQATVNDPDGTQDQYRDIAGSALAADTWVVPGLMTSDGTDGGVKRSVTRNGSLLCVVIEFSTFTAADVLNIATLNNNGTSMLSELAGSTYVDHFTASWTDNTQSPVFALKYDDGSYEFVPGNFAWSLITTNTFNSTSTPDERSMAFQFGAPLKVGGAWVRIDGDGDYEAVLYEGTTALDTVSIDKDHRNASAAINRYIRFSDDILIDAGVDHFLSIKPTSATNLSTYDFDVASAAIMDSFEGGQNFQAASRVDAGAWTKVATKRPMMGLHVTALDDGAAAGGGGMLVHPGMVGGLRG